MRFKAFHEFARHSGRGLYHDFHHGRKVANLYAVDLAKPAQKRELDFDFIHKAVVNNDIWALDWKYPGLQLNVRTSLQVELVCDILDMWDRLEKGLTA